MWFTTFCHLAFNPIMLLAASIGIRTRMSRFSVKDYFTSLWYCSCKRLFSPFRIASNSFFESGSGVAVVGPVVVCTEGANSDGTWWYASRACENYGVYPRCGRPRLELPFAVNTYWFALNWGGPTFIGDCIDCGSVVAICIIQANLNQNVWFITTFVRQTTGLPALITSSIDIFGICLLNDGATTTLQHTTISRISYSNSTFNASG
jgi:hypothetical protein